jgi:hypothetical protein
MGPCWLMINEAQDDSFHVRYSNSRYEYTVNDPKNVEVNHAELLNRSAPHMSVMSLSFRTWRNEKNKNEIVAIGGIMHDSM